jgi:hypothetical protein
MLNKAYSRFASIKDIKDAANLCLEADRASRHSVKILSSIEVFLRLHPVLGFPLGYILAKDDLFSILRRSEDEVEVHLVEPVVKALAVFKVEIVGHAVEVVETSIKHVRQ